MLFLSLVISISKSNVDRYLGSQSASKGHDLPDRAVSTSPYRLSRDRDLRIRETTRVARNESQLLHNESINYALSYESPALSLFPPPVSPSTRYRPLRASAINSDV